MRFYLKNTDTFPLPNGFPTPTGDCFLHLATIGYGLREFIAFACVRGPSQGQAYIEEAVLVSNSNNQEVAANLTRIKDENLKYDLAQWLEDKQLLDMEKRFNEIISKGKLEWLTG